MRRSCAKLYETRIVEIRVREKAVPGGQPAWLPQRVRTLATLRRATTRHRAEAAALLAYATTTAPLIATAHFAARTSN